MGAQLIILLVMIVVATRAALACRRVLEITILMLSLRAANSIASCH